MSSSLTSLLAGFFTAAAAIAAFAGFTVEYRQFRSKARLRGRRRHTPDAAATLALFAAEFPDYRLRYAIRADDTRCVFRAESTVTRQRVIIKQVLVGSKYEAQLRSGLLNEVQMLTFLNGKVAPDFIEIKRGRSGQPFLVTAELKGRSLASSLRRVLAWPALPTIDDAYSALIGATRSLDELHRSGIAHGDISPANLVAVWTKSSMGGPTVRPADEIIFVDFELAEFIDKDRQATTRNYTRGTFGFISPERLVRPMLSVAGDIYAVAALGALLFTGRVQDPAASDSVDVPEQLLDVISIGMRLDPRERFATASVMLEALLAGQAQLSSTERRRRVQWDVDAFQWFAGPRSLTARTWFLGATQMYDEEPSGTLDLTSETEGESTAVEILDESLLAVTSERDRAVAKRFFRDGQGIVEIAAEERISEADTRATLTRVKEDLEERLKPEVVRSDPDE